MGSASLNGSGQATLTVSSLPLGANKITAGYGGESDVKGATPAQTAVSVARADSHMVLVLHKGLKKKKVVSLTLEAKAEPKSPGAGVPTGTVKFELIQKKKNPKVLGTASLSGGNATLSVKPSSVQNESIEIVYSGDADFHGSDEVVSIKLS